MPAEDAAGKAWSPTCSRGAVILNRQGLHPAARDEHLFAGVKDAALALRGLGRTPSPDRFPRLVCLSPGTTTP